MSFKKFRWSKDYEAAEEALELFLDSRGHDLQRYELAADSELPPVQFNSERQLWCAEGSVRLTIGAQTVTLQPGDAISIAAEQSHSLFSGVAGCVSYEQ